MNIRRRFNAWVLVVLVLLVGFSFSNTFLAPRAYAAQVDVTPPAGEVDNALAVSISPSKVKESNDFATQILTDPWDMTEFSDISRYLNESNVVQHLTNIQVANGVFSARSLSTDPQFYTIFPGYQSSIDSLNIPVLSGSLFPIDSAKYRCLYSRMKIETNSGDAMRIFWFADKYLGNGQFGVTKSIAIPSSAWQLYSIDLKTNFDSANSNTAWSNAAYWRGLRFDPTTLSGVNFAVDWVRLTDCAAVNTNLTWTPGSGTMEIWTGIGAKTLDFKVGTVDGASGSTTLDVQGWQAGSYYVGLKDSAGNISWISQPLVIDGAPLVSFARPSFDTGVSYTWTMNSSSDLVTDPNQTRCVDFSFQNGMLNLVTQPPANLPDDCTNTTIWGAIASDPQLVLSMPSQKIDTSLYRYLTFRMNMDGMIQDVNRGWHMRWLWETYENNDPNKWCINVSNDIVFDPAWQTIMVDLHDGPSGTTEDWVGYNGCYSRHWTSNPAVWLRLDPNENTTGTTFTQMIDSITLSQVDSVTRGQLFPVQVKSNESFSNLNISLFYTNNRQVYNQNQATVRTITAPPLAAHRIYLPFTLRNASISGGINPNATVLYWDTTNVAAGTYYVCMEANDGLNKSTSCSLAPINVR